MIKLSSIITEHTDILATIETWDNGKIYGDALADVAEVEAVFKYYGGYADKIHGQVIDTGIAKFAYTLKEPIGVCGQIIPWNYPLGMAAWKLGPALACGNAVVIKAAEQTPLSILYFANLVKEAGFPPGVVNIINGHGREAGAAIATHPNIDKVAFTGSTATGKEIMKMAAGTMKSITLETGGKSPLLVFEDADLDQAVKWAHLGRLHPERSTLCYAFFLYPNPSIFFLLILPKVSCRIKAKYVQQRLESLYKIPFLISSSTHLRNKSKKFPFLVIRSPKPHSKDHRLPRLNTSVY